VQTPLSFTFGQPHPGEAQPGQASFRRLLAVILEAAQASGGIRRDIAAVELSQMLATLYAATVIVGYATPGERSAAADAEQCLSEFLDGARTRSQE
jgi:hypothetical protein